MNIKKNMSAINERGLVWRLVETTPNKSNHFDEKNLTDSEPTNTQETVIKTTLI